MPAAHDLRGVDDARAQAAWQARLNVRGIDRSPYAEGYLSGLATGYREGQADGSRARLWLLLTIFATGAMLGVLLRTLWR